jgi:hypothetical protein
VKIFKAVERRRAVERGLDFIYRIACDRRNFAEYGSDLLCCFYYIASTAGDSASRRAAWEMGKERARQWRAEHASLPPDADPDIIVNFVYGSDAADRLGVCDGALKEQIRRAAGRFSAQDYLGFDPAREPPPGDFPETCDCGVVNDRGRKKCSRCKKRLTLMSRYLVWYDALIRAYSGERYGVALGARYADVISWLPAMRPYRGREGDDNPDFYDTAYAVTHVVYTLNNYNLYALSPRWLPAEFAFLKSNLAEAIAMEDPEMVGEFVDALRAFGLTENAPLIRTGMEYLLSRQNQDGSWGEADAEDVYGRYHPTWTAIDGLREYARRGRGLSFSELKPLLAEWAGGEARPSRKQTPRAV